MAIPVGDTYTVASGQAIFAGRSNVSFVTGDAVVAGDSLTALSFNSGGYRLGIPLMLFPPRVLHNAGIAGNTIKQLVDRFQTDVVAKGAQIAIIRIGTNGPGVGTYQDQYTALFNMLQTAGMFGIFHAVPPKGLGTAGVVAPFVAQNAWLKQQCLAAPTRLAFVEDSQGLGDEFYNVIPGFFSDNIHMNSKGVYVEAKAMAPILGNILAKQEARLLDATDVFPTSPSSNQYVSNPHMAGSGALPTNWTSSLLSGATVTTAIVAADAGDPVQVPWLRVTYTGATGSASAHVARTVLQHPAIDSTIKRFDTVAEVRFNSLDTTNINRFSYGVDVGSGLIAGATVPINGNGIITERMVLRDALQRDTTLTYLANTLRFAFTLEFSGAAGAVGSIDIRCVSVRGQTT